MGSIDRLGVLPVAIALFLQFRDAQFTWPLNVTFSEWLLGTAVLSVYLGGLLGQSLRLRLHLYETLLAEALREDPTTIITGK